MGNSAADDKDENGNLARETLIFISLDRNGGRRYILKYILRQLGIYLCMSVHSSVPSNYSSGGPKRGLRDSFFFH